MDVAETLRIWWPVLVALAGLWAYTIRLLWTVARGVEAINNRLDSHDSKLTDHADRLRIAEAENKDLLVRVARLEERQPKRAA